MTRWTEAAGDDSGERYAQRFSELASSGASVHGEADFCSHLVPSGGDVLDAGCGTGRVAVELERRGRRCVGVDVDASMLRVAERSAPDTTWVLADLTALDLGRRFDLVVAAGNVMPLLAAGTEPDVVRRLAHHLTPVGLLVAGFGLDGAHLPLDSAPFGLREYDAWCCDAGLELVARFATWQRDAFSPGDGYAVSVHHLGP
jgi:SAM-dependent methyltransferase